MIFLRVIVSSLTATRIQNAKAYLVSIEKDFKILWDNEEASLTFSPAESADALCKTIEHGGSYPGDVVIVRRGDDALFVGTPDRTWPHFDITRDQNPGISADGLFSGFRGRALLECAREHREANASGHPGQSPKKPRLRRTLLGAAIGALLAMLMVPYVRGHRNAADTGYLPIYEIGAQADVNVAQLILNISYARVVEAVKWGGLAAALASDAASASANISPCMA
jgi:hypothetical protein